MEALYDIRSLLLILILFIAAVQFISGNKLKKENKLLLQILETKNTTIANLEASRAAVKDVIENLSMSEEVISLINSGESREAISVKLGIPVEKIEFILKIDKIRKEHTRHT